MQVPVIQINRPQPTFGVLKGYKKTPYGEYTWGVLRNRKFEVFNAYKHDQKLIYVSEIPTLRWLASKLRYLKNGEKKVVKCTTRSYEV